MTFRPRDTSRPPLEEDAACPLPALGHAPELDGVGPWFNTPDGEPLSLATVRDRVVLLEFWTFACGNCQRTLPFLRRMHDHYQPDFTVVGIHTPEFPFERSAENVERALREHKLEYPVGRYAHIGEGDYGRAETAIRTLLAEAAGAAGETRAAS